MTYFSDLDLATLEDRIVRKVHEHEALISFNNDSDGVAFRVWWNRAGHDAFKDWVAEHEEELVEADPWAL